MGFAGIFNYQTIRLHLHTFLGQVQRQLQLRIEEQGRQLKMMIDQQQKTNSSLFQIHNLDTSFAQSSDVQVSISQGSGISQFPSKIS